MKKLFFLAPLMVLSSLASAQENCTIQTRVYVPKTIVNKYVSSKLTSEVKDWRECYSRALQQAKDYKPLETARVQVKIFNITVSDRDRHVHFLTDWTVSSDPSEHKIKGTVNESSPPTPALGPQAR